MKKPIGIIAAKILGSTLLLITLIMGGAFLYYSIRSTVSVATRPGTLHELTMEEKLADFNYMYKILEENHPYFEVVKRKTGYDWLAHREDFEGWIKAAENNKEYYSTIERILFLIQNGHTNIIRPESYDEYKRLYSGMSNKAWGSVLNDEGVAAKYEEWKKIVQTKNTLVPLSFKYIEGDYVVTNPFFINEDVLKKHGIPKYSILMAVNGINIDDYVKLLTDKRFLKYDNKRSKLKSSSLSIPCDVDEKTELTFLTPLGEILNKSIAGIEYAPEYNSREDAERLYQTAIIEKNKLAYLKVESFSAFNVEKDRAGIYEFYKSIKDYPYLIIDIRGNGGGSENYYTRNLVPPLIDKNLKASFYIVFRDGKYIKPFLASRMMFTKPIKNIPDGLNYPEETKRDFSSFLTSSREISPRDSVGFTGQIFLLVDDYVYSSAESFAALTKATGFATIVGTRTGGDGIGIDPAIFALPSSGLLIRFPLEMGLNPDGTSSEEASTEPDIYVEQTYEDFVKYNEYKGGLINPYDTVINRVIEMIN